MREHEWIDLIPAEDKWRKTTLLFLHLRAASRPISLGVNTLKKQLIIVFSIYGDESMIHPRVYTPSKINIFWKLHSAYKSLLGRSF